MKCVELSSSTVTCNNILIRHWFGQALSIQIPEPSIFRFPKINDELDSFDKSFSPSQWINRRFIDLFHNYKVIKIVAMCQIYEPNNVSRKMCQRIHRDCLRRDVFWWKGQFKLSIGCKMYWTKLPSYTQTLNTSQKTRNQKPIQSDGDVSSRFYYSFDLCVYICENFT